jgi:hypothetical protein
VRKIEKAKPGTEPTAEGKPLTGAGVGAGFPGCRSAVRPAVITARDPANRPPRAVAAGAVEDVAVQLDGSGSEGPLDHAEEGVGAKDPPPTKAQPLGAEAKVEGTMCPLEMSGVAVTAVDPELLEASPMPPPPPGRWPVGATGRVGSRPAVRVVEVTVCEVTVCVSS